MIQCKSGKNILKKLIYNLKINRTGINKLHPGFALGSWILALYFNSIIDVPINVPD